MADAMRERHVSGLVLVGGETAFGVLSAAYARGARVAGQVLPGMPLGTVMGRTADGRLMVTKAGGFGGEAALVEVLDHVRRLRGS